MAQGSPCALVVLAAWALAGLPEVPGAGKPTNSLPWKLSCSRSCCQASCRVNCTWEVPGGTTETTATLNFRYPNEDEETRQTFEVGQATFFLLHPDQVYALKNAVVWVESRTADGRLRCSENRTLLISKAIKFHPPVANSIGFSRSQRRMTLTWPESHGCHHLPKELEVRMRPRTASNWTRGNCIPGKDDGAMERVACRVEENVPYEVQVRFRIAHWSSLWSEWSGSVLVPAEILQSPKVNFTAERLGGDGLRNVTLEWERPSADQGEVNYSLTFVLLPCRGCPYDMEIFTHVVRNQTLHQVALSGAGYNISLQASNEAGAAPESFSWLPPEQNAGPSILNVSLSGQTFTARWKATVDADFFCFESQAFGDPPSETPCGEDDVKAGEVYENSGVMEPNRCYRLAVHGLGQATTAWSTFGLTYLFQRNTSLEDPIRLNVTKQTAHSATVRWDPPRNLAACPGVLKKYVLCCRKDEGGSPMAYYDANASAREFIIPDLQPQTAYLAGVWASTDGAKRNCRAVVLFLTDPPDSKSMSLTLSFLSLGIFIAFLTVAGGVHIGKKRIQVSLWPPLPDPSGTEAVKILSEVEPDKVHRWRHFMEPQESGSLVEPFLVESPSEKGESSRANATEDSPAAVEELQPPKEDPLSSWDPLPSEYKAQGFLNPGEEEPPGGGELGGLSHQAAISERC